MSHIKDEKESAEIKDGGITPQPVEITKGKIDPSSLE